MLILICNAGSTSLKFKLLSFPQEDVLAECKIERIGDANKGIYRFWGASAAEHVDSVNVETYESGIVMFMKSLYSRHIAEIKDINCIGFKTVMAKGYSGIHEIRNEVIDGMKSFLDAAPVHNRAYLECITVMKRLFPQTLMMGVFESAFHATIPEYERIYALPWQWYERDGVMKLGFHGASHGFIARRIKELYGPVFKAVSCHLGGSSSLCAIKDGRSMANTFGFTPQTGIPHSSRTGDFDIFTLPYLMNLGKSPEQILDELSHDGGIKGLSGISGDMREVEDAFLSGNKRAELAIRHYVNEIIKHIGAYYASLGGIDVLVFTAGIGEHSSLIRGMVCQSIPHIGIDLDEKANSMAAGETLISAPQSKVRVYVIPANEELAVARQIKRCLALNIKDDIWQED